MGLGWEQGSRGRKHVYLWLIHIVLWLKLTQHGKAVILQLKISFKKDLTFTAPFSFFSGFAGVFPFYSEFCSHHLSLQPVV